MQQTSVLVALLGASVALLLLGCTVQPAFGGAISRDQDQDEQLDSSPSEVDSAEADTDPDPDWSDEPEYRPLSAAIPLAVGDNNQFGPQQQQHFGAASANNNQRLVWPESMLDGDEEPSRLDSNIENAKVQLTAGDMATAAGHHHHHKHYPHGWLKMGAHTGKKGSFGWHDKHPVGGKGRR